MMPWRRESDEKMDRELLIASKERAHCKQYAQNICLMVGELRDGGPGTVSELAGRMKVEADTVRLSLIGARILGYARAVKEERDYKVWPYGRGEEPRGVDVEAPQWDLIGRVV